MSESGAIIAENWLRSLIETFRKSADNLSDSERRSIGNLEDFSEPCQLWLFWFQMEPLLDYALLIRTRLSQVPDGTARVVGPMQPGEAQARLLDVVSWPEWNEVVEDRFFLPVIEGDRSVRFWIALTCKEALAKLENAVLRAVGLESPLPAGIGERTRTPGNGFAWHIYGDPTKLDVTELVARTVDEARQQAKQAGKPEIARPPEPSPEEKRLQAFGALIYPPVWIGETPTQTPEDILLGRTPRDLIMGVAPKALDAEYKGRPIVVNRDGFIAAAVQSRRDAATLLNEIMAAAGLSGFEFLAVRENELAETTILEPGRTTSGMSWQIVSLRTAELSQFHRPLRDLYLMMRLSESAIRQFIVQAGKLAGAPPLQNISIFLLESRTHLAASEFRQAYVMAWIAIESWLNWLWLSKLNELGVSKTRIKRLTSSDRWTAEIVSETLNLLGVMDNTQLTKVSAMRKIRNKIVHVGVNPTEAQVRDCIEFASSALFRVL